MQEGEEEDDVNGEGRRGGGREGRRQRDKKRDTHGHDREQEM